MFNAEFLSSVFGLFLLVAQNSETAWTSYKREEYSWPRKNKGSHMCAVYKEWFAYAIMYLSHTQAWGLHMHVPISDNLGVFGKMHISQPQISIQKFKYYIVGLQLIGTCECQYNTPF